jgi:hypothetical protein
LKFDRRADGLDGACEFGQDPVASQLDDPSTISGKSRFKAIAATLLQAKQRAGLITAHEPRISGDIRRHDRRQFALLPCHRNSLVPILRPPNRS